MSRKSFLTAIVLIVAASAFPARAAERGGFRLQVLVGGVPRTEYASGETAYVEAVKGRDYQLSITNPLPCRVAVALSIDGLNTINAKRSDVGHASKWVLGPYETVTISGWQINGAEARKFFFTGEKQSYGAWLGQTQNLGVIEAAFFREKPVPPPRPILMSPPPCPAPAPGEGGMEGGIEGGVLGSVLEQSKSEARGDSSSRAKPQAEKVPSPSLSNDFAATGIGSKVDHGIEWVSLDLERRPSAVLRVRYEFRPQLVKLGLLPAPRPCPDPLERREHASGFSGTYCPDPYAAKP